MFEGLLQGEEPRATHLPELSLKKVNGARQERTDGSKAMEKRSPGWEGGGREDFQRGRNRESGPT